MNDPTYVEAARFLAQRMIAKAARRIESRLTHGFRTAPGRDAEPAELPMLDTPPIERASS